MGSVQAPVKPRAKPSDGSGSGTKPPISHLADLFEMFFGVITKGEVKALCGTTLKNVSIGKPKDAQLCVVCAELYRSKNGEGFPR